MILEKEKFVIGAVALVLVLVGGLYLLSTRQSATEDTGIPLPPRISVQGAVTAVGQDSITISAMGPQGTESIIAYVAVGTPVYLDTFKEPTILQREMDAYMSARQEAGTAMPEPPPSPYNRKEITLADLEVGAQVTVQAREVVPYGAESFDAVSISQIVMNLPAPPVILTPPPAEPQ